MSNKLIVLCCIVLVFIGCGTEHPPKSEGNNRYLIEVAELQEMIDRPHIKLVDFRKEAEFKEGHIAHSVNVTRAHVEDPAYPYKGMMATKQQMENLLGGLGIGTADTLVIYDDNGLCNAARLWWILQNYDFDQVKLLHGGLNAWERDGGEVTSETYPIAKANFQLPDDPSMRYRIGKDEVLKSLHSNTVIIDTRTDDEFTGKRQKKGALKGGRIPSAIHIDWAHAIDYNGDKRIRSTNELEELYAPLKNAPDKQVIVYCHTGMRSAHTTFILSQVMGFQNVLNYDGSWTEWSHFEDLPVEQDSLTVLN